MRRLIASALVTLVAGVPLVSDCTVQAQEVATASYERGPRFLLATATEVVPVDVGKTAVLARRLSLDLEGATLKKALTEITSLSGLRLAYSDDLVPLRQRVHLRADAITVAAALTDVLFDAGVDVVFKPDGSAALVKRPPAVPLQEGAIVGRVTDRRAGDPIVGATVMVGGTGHTATTDEDGRYRIERVPAGIHTVRVRYIGYEPRAVSVTVSAGQDTRADFALEMSAQRLDEVVTTGTVIPTEVKALPSPITIITADEIRERNAQRLDQLFQGEVPGVFSFNTSAGDDITRLYVRGSTSLAGIGEVKTYVDGVELSAPSFLSVIDPNSIERIELIRGPQASTIYGSQALGGVLQIFTKRGSRSTSPQLEGRVEAGAIQTKWVPGHDVAPTYRANLTVAGGSERFSYTVGATRLYRGEFIERFQAGENTIFGSFRGGQGWLTAEFAGRIHVQNRHSPLNPISEPYVDLFRRAQEDHNNYQNTAVGLTLHAQVTPFWRQTLTVGADRFLQEYNNVEAYGPTDPLRVFSHEGLRQSVLYTNALHGALSASLSGSLTAGVNLVADKSASFSGSGPRTTGGISTINYVFRDDATNRGYFAQAQLGIADQLFLTAGLRAEDNPFYGENYGLAWSPRVGASYVRTLGSLTIKPRVSYGESIRPPSSSARLGSEGTTFVTLANPDIGPEAQRGFDAGVEFYFGTRATLQATYYDQTVDGLINRVLLDKGPPEVDQQQNIGQIKNRGLELDGSIEVTHGLTLRGTYSIAVSEVQRLSPSYTGDLRLGDQLLGVPKYSGGASVQYVTGDWMGQVGMRYASSWTHYRLTDYYRCAYTGVGCRNDDFGLRDYWGTYEGFTKFRMNLSRRLDERLSIHLDVENLANDDTFEETDSSAPIGRTTTLGVNFRL